MVNKKGFYWHVHHNCLVEYCYNYNERVNAIKTTKSLNEIDERLRLLQPVKGKLSKEVVGAGQARHKARQAYAKAWEVWIKEQKAYCKACEVYIEALRDNREVIEKLHAQECPDCSWNGQELVFPK